MAILFYRGLAVIRKHLEPLCALKGSPAIVGKLKQFIDKNKEEKER